MKLDKGNWIFFLKENCMKREFGFLSIINSNFYIFIYKRFSVGFGF